MFFSDLKLDFEASLDLISMGPAGFSDSFDSFMFRDLGNNIIDSVYQNGGDQIMGGGGSLPERIGEVTDMFGSEPHVDLTDTGADIRWVIPETGSEWVWSVGEYGSGNWIETLEQSLGHYWNNHPSYGEDPYIA